MAVGGAAVGWYFTEGQRLAVQLTAHARLVELALEEAWVGVSPHQLEDLLLGSVKQSGQRLRDDVSGELRGALCVDVDSLLRSSVDVLLENRSSQLLSLKK